MVQINFEDLKSLRTNNKNKKIVFCSGSFDLTHAGHIIFFEDCKELGDLLVVSIGGDKLLRRYKGDLRPILNQSIRLKTIDSLKPVDYCFVEPDFPEGTFWLEGIKVVFESLKPDVYVINEDAKEIEFRKKLCDQYHVKMVVLKRHCPEEFDNISTTSIIEKVVKSYK